MSSRLQFDDMLIAEDGDYALGIERTTGRRYLSIDAESGGRHFEISDEEFERLLDDRAAGAIFARRCRSGDEDRRLFGDG